MSYDPAAMSAADADAIAARARRYCARHGSPYGETPIPGGDIDEAVQVILTDTLAADWTALEWTYLQRNGRTLFPADLSDLGRHMRAMLFMAGRARRRGWVEAGPMRRAARAEARRRDMDDSRGAGMASRAPDPARVAEAIESALRYGIRATPVDEQGKRLRWVKTRNTVGYTLDVVARHPDRTDIAIRAYTRYNFRRAGSVPLRREDNAHYTPVYGIGRVVRSRPNPAMSKTLKRMPAGTTPAMLSEAIG